MGGSASKRPQAETSLNKGQESQEGQEATLASSSRRSKKASFSTRSKSHRKSKRTLKKSPLAAAKAKSLKSCSTDSGQGYSSNSSYSDQDSLCPFCDEADSKKQLLYCSKGSLCSRRSKATLKSRQVPGRRGKKRPFISNNNNIYDTSSSLASLASPRSSKGKSLILPLSRCLFITKRCYQITNSH